jgi:hypothetical protein
MEFLRKTQYLSIKKNIYMIYHVKRPKFWAALFFLGTLLMTVGCEKPEEDLGIDLQPENDLFSVGGIDTFTVIAYTVPEDSIRTDQVNPAIFGAYTDPVFGFAKASHITQVRLSSGAPDFTNGTNIDDVIIDSLILVLGYIPTTALPQSHYGRLGQQYVQVFELSQPLDQSAQYYQNSTVRLFPDDLIKEGYNLITPRPDDSVTVAGVKRAPQMRIPLKHELAQRFIEAGNGPGLDVEEFIELFKGIQVTVDESKFNTQRSGIIYFDTFTQTSFIAMHYKTLVDPEAAIYDTLSYIFPISSNTAKFGSYTQDHNLGRASLRDQVINNNILPGRQDLYIQAMGGTKVLVELPYIENLRDSAELAINRAVLRIPVRAVETEGFEPPGQLFIFGTTNEGSSYLLPDQIDQNIGGNYDPEIQAYEFNISRYVQQILLGTRDNNPLEIVTSRAASSANRVVMNGPDYPSAENPENNTTLRITFTKY